MGGKRVDSTTPKADKGIVSEIKKFADNSQKFMEKCSKPNKEEYLKILAACSVGFVVMGLIGYFIKLIFIPINNIILGSAGVGS
eukprot:CAMPEP_0168325476 /NCGR_PEP_ID=MMETSP0213-20121227/4714_1 /TAXON_ID=151035 /ORGANISM="Euplotes harpa, Strain FSP1.4" /LENGTH=83 /DNA_ID=CAMNT_0008327975 /DNA_START=11 /DNA_END=262 /DNA_ORIENTATION=-